MCMFLSLFLSLSRCIKWIGAKKMFVIFEESFFSLPQANKQTSWCNTPQAMNVRSSVTVYYICALYLNVSIENVIIIFICIIAQKLAKRKQHKKRTKQMGISWDLDCQQRILSEILLSHLTMCVCVFTIDHHRWWPTTCSDISVCWFVWVRVSFRLFSQIRLSCFYHWP